MPLLPAITINQLGTLLVAVHAQPAGELTVVLPLAPFAATDALVGFNVNVQPAAA